MVGNKGNLGMEREQKKKISPYNIRTEGKSRSIGDVGEVEKYGPKEKREKNLWFEVYVKGGGGVFGEGGRERILLKSKKKDPKKKMGGRGKPLKERGKELKPEIYEIWLKKMGSKKGPTFGKEGGGKRSKRQL